MEKKSGILTKENSLILRGVAILAIMFHNFLHNPIFGFIPENEKTFAQENANAFFAKLAEPNFTIVFETFSFLGWIGVPVFVFLTGYGLATKYPIGSLQSNFNKCIFIKKSYLKLFVLLAPALLFFACLDIKNEAWGNLAKRIIELSMLYNLEYPHLRVSPGVYWYFSLTFQYYLLYCFCNKWFKPKLLLFLSVLSILLLFLLIRSDMTTIQWIYRACFPGWFPLFAMGIWFTYNKNLIKRIEDLPIYIALIVFAILSVLIVVANANIISWLVLPIISVLFFILLAKIIIYVPYIYELMKKVGALSAFIFVCHPISRVIVFTLCRRYNYDVQPLFTSLFLYTILTFFLAYYYQKLHIKLSSRYI